VEFTESVINKSDLGMTGGDFKDNTYFSDFETPTCDAYNDDDIPVVSMPNLDGIADDVEIYGQYAGALVQLPIGDQIKSGKVTG
jgi:hypothetical protein